MRHPVVKVKWIDSVSQDGWTDDLNIPPHTIHSVGFLVKKTEHYLTLALCHDTDNDDYACLMTIPLVCVLETTFL